MKQQYDSLLQQVRQQHSLIQQLSESQASQISEDQISCMESEDTETGGEFKKNANKTLMLLYYENIYTKLSVTVCSAEATGQTETESPQMKDELTPTVSEQDELSPDSDESFRYSEFCMKLKCTNMIT